ncbi:hypothetical protein LIER_39399 [Lithospermum erythrorhizon]|uniref:Uncharacterized protein n=1 Tax=Lithospermum erythrorhizon TaxID=34254 RepID=A0AAV3QGF0_LITER
MVETGTGLNQQLSLARAGDTRWGSHYRVLLRLKKMFTPIVEVLEELKYDRTTSEAKVSTTSVERAFSGMNYMMDYLRTKMSNAWLNDCLVTFVEKEVFCTVDDRDIINRFQVMRERRMQIKLK